MATSASNPLDDLGATPVAPDDTSTGNPLEDLGATPVAAGAQPNSGPAQPPKNPLDDLGAIPAQASIPDQEYEKVRKLADRHFWESPLTGTETTTDQELAAIARKHGVDLDALKEAAPLFGAKTERESEELGAGVEAAANRAMLAGIPQFIGKKTTENPKMRLALDDVRELADAKRSLLQSGAEMLAPGGAIGRIGKGLKGLAAGGAATGAIYGLTGSREGEEVKGTVIGTGLGTLAGLGAGFIANKLAGVGEKSGTAVEKTATESTPKLIQEGVESSKIEIEKGVDQILDQRKDLNSARKDFILGGAESTPELLSRTEQALPERVRQNTPAEQLTMEAGKDLQESAIDFSGYLAKEIDETIPSRMEEAGRVIDQFRKQIGPEALERTYSDWERLRAGQEYLDSTGLRAAPDVYGGLHRALEIPSGTQNILKITDHQYGTKLYPEFLRYNNGKNRTTFAQAGAEKLAVEPTREMEKARLDPEEIGKMLDGTLEINPQAAPVVEKWRGVLNDTKDLLQKGDPGAGVPGLPIRMLEEYFPSQVPEVAEFVVRVENKIREMDSWTRDVMGKKLSELSDAEIQGLDAKAPEFSEFLRGLGWLDKNEIRTQAQLQNAMTRSQQPAVIRDISDMRAASPTFQREGKVPDWIREWDVRKVFARYASPTINYMYTREPFRRIQDQAKLLRKAGAARQADYVEKWASNMMSVPSRSIHSSTSAIANKVRILALRAADKAPEGSAREGFYQTLAAAPDFLTHITHNIYPNTLGLSPRAIIRNLPQALLATAPEMGGPYGYKLAVRGYVDAAANWSKLTKEVERLGLAPERFTAENRDYLRRGIQQSLPYKVADKYLEKLSAATMYFYEKSDMVNRAVTLSIADKWAQDLLEKNGSAVASLRKAPTAIQREALHLAGTGNADGLRALLASHLNSTTQFNYNRASLSEFGRVMGPLFTTFTKWPSEVLGDVYHIANTGGASTSGIRLAGKYLIPLVTLGGMQRLLFGSADDMTDREKKLVGAEGLADWAPIMSVGSILKGDIMTPPAVDVATKIIKAGMGEDADATEVGRKAAAAITQSFVPGAGLLRAITDDAVTILTGKRPDGDFLERTQGGFHQLTK